MSEFYLGVTAGSLPPTVPTSFVTDDATSATPVANVLNILTAQSSANNDKGIQDSAAGNTVTITSTNRLTGTVTTTTAATTQILSFALGATSGSFFIVGNVEAFNSSTPAAGAYTFSAGFITDGATATLLGTEFHDSFESVALTASDIFVTASGNNCIISVAGIAGLTLNWNALLEFRQVT